MEYVIAFILGVFIAGFFFLIQKQKIENKVHQQLNKERQAIMAERRKIDEDFTAQRSQLTEEINKEISLRKKQAEEDLLKYINERRQRFEYEAEEDFKSFKELHITSKEELSKELKEMEEALALLRVAQDSYNAEVFRRKEIEEGADFYKIVLEESEIDDIENLKKVEKLLHNKEILNKLIYSTYLQKPLRQLTNRVLGGDKVCGIYKITYIKTGEAYIGRSVDVKERWQQHVRSSLNIGTIASSYLHTKMAQEGVQNFSFELLEEVARDQLNEREKYYINFYDTAKQLNIKEG